MSGPRRSGTPPDGSEGRRVRAAVARAILVLSFLAVGLRAQDPSGYIEAYRWACLLPLDGIDCTGGGLDILEGDWFPTRALARENPVAQTEWGELLGAGAGFSRYLGSGRPRFVRWSTGADPTIVDLGAYLRARGQPDRFVLAFAVTYVRNTTDEALPVGLCTSSDDSIEVWINASRVLARSACRALDPGCAEVTRTVLAPGVNRILVAVWQGVGEFAFRLGFRKPDGSAYTNADPEIEPLGALSNEGAPWGKEAVRRTLEVGDGACPAPVHRVRILGWELESEPRTRKVVEELRGPIQSVELSEISRGGWSEEIAPGPPTAGPFREAQVGVPCSSDNQTTLEGDIYTTRATTGGDIGLEGDVFEYAYQFLEGDFDIAVEFVERQWAPTGRWGKAGLMARWSLDPASRHGHIQDHGPDPQDAARYARRRVHLVEATAEEVTTTEGLTDPAGGGPLLHPRYQRLTRRGDSLLAWVSASAGDDGMDPSLDENWALLHEEDWSGAPEDVYVGFASSVHESSGCATQVLRWRLIALRATSAEPPPEGVRIRWTVEREDLAWPGVSYTLAGPPGVGIVAEGYAGGLVTEGPRHLDFQAGSSGPVGIFEAASDVGAGGPCTPGSFSVDAGDPGNPEDDLYRIVAGGLDVWSKGDQFHFGHASVSGDFLLEAHVDSVEHPFLGSRWGKFGLMTRWNCRPDAAYFFVHDNAASDPLCEIDGPRVAFRPWSGVSGGNEEAGPTWWQDVFGWEPLAARCLPLDPDPRANDLRGDERNLAPWLRLIRRGNTFWGQASPDGEEWRTLGSHSWPIVPDTLQVGLAATSHAGCPTVRVRFDSVRLEPLPPLDPAFELPPPAHSGELLLREGFDGTAPGRCPTGWVCSGYGTGNFRPRVLGGRLRIADLAGAVPGGGNLATTAFLDRSFAAETPILIEFDVFAHFEASLASPAGLPGDGLALVALATHVGTDGLHLRVGDAGGELGYGRIQLSRDERSLRSVECALASWAVELDLWTNAESRNEGDGSNASLWDPDGGRFGNGSASWHAAIDAAGSTASVVRNLQMGILDRELPDIYAPEGVHVRVFHDHGRVLAWMRPGSAGEDEEMLVLEAEVEPLDASAPEILLGFTAGTGDASCRLEVDDLEIRELHPEDDDRFHRGDANDDGRADIADGVFVLNYLFIGGRDPPCLDASDSNGDGTINISDGIHVLNFLFLGGPPPAPPGPPPAECGGTKSLGCISYTHC